MYDALRAADTSATTKLHSIAAALEMWPTALLLNAKEACADASTSVVVPCIHAALQSLVSSFQQERTGRQFATTARAGLSVPANAAPDNMSTAAREKSKLAVQCWGRNRFTHTAASQLHDMYAQHWQQQQQSKCTDDGAHLACPPQQAGTLWGITLLSVAAKFQQLCTEGPADEGETVMRWLQLHTSLELAISCMGWEWALDQVLSHACLLASNLRPSSCHWLQGFVSWSQGNVACQLAAQQGLQWARQVFAYDGQLTVH